MVFYLNQLIIFTFVACFSQEAIARKENIITGDPGELVSIIGEDYPYVRKANLTKNNSQQSPTKKAINDENGNLINIPEDAANPITKDILPQPLSEAKNNLNANGGVVDDAPAGGTKQPSLEEMPPFPPIEEPLPPLPLEEMPPFPPIEEALPPLPLEEMPSLPPIEEALPLVLGEPLQPSASEIGPIVPEIEEMPSPVLTTENDPLPAPTEVTPPTLTTEEIMSPTPEREIFDNAPVLGDTSALETTPTERASQLSLDKQSNAVELIRPEAQAQFERQPAQEGVRTQNEASQVAQAAAQNQYQARALQKAEQRQTEQSQLMEQQTNSRDFQDEGQSLQQQVKQEQFQREAAQRSERRQAIQILDAQEAVELQERERAHQKQERMEQQRIGKWKAPIQMAKVDEKVEVAQSSEDQSAGQMENKSSKNTGLTNEGSKHYKTPEHKGVQLASATTMDEHGNSINESESKNSEKIEGSSHH